jgi:HK97 gp10 family phage protein
MAEISTSGLEELLSDMEAIAEIPDATILEMLSAEAGVIAEAQAAEARAMGVVDKGVTARSITFDKKLKVTKDGKAIYVYPKGSRSDGSRRRVAEVAFVNEFGKKGQPARPFINTANVRKGDEAVKAAAEVYDSFLKSKNL